jgi:thiamine biosynthesis protein ThiS
VIVNSKPKTVTAGITLAALLDELGVERRAVAVAHNEDVVPRDRYDLVALQDGDRVEIVRMVGGG